MFGRQFWQSVVTLNILASCLVACGQVASQPQPIAGNPINPQPDQVGTSENGVVEPDGAGQSGTAQSGVGVAQPATVGGGTTATPRKVKASDMARPGTGDYTIRQYEQKVQKELFEHGPGIITELKDNQLGASLGTRFHFYVLRYPIWPLARNINPPLSTNNIFVLDETNKFYALVTSSEQLEKFFGQHVHPVRSPQEARPVLIAWLRLQQELAQDGMFQFNIPETSLHVMQGSDGKISAAGQSIVVPTGGNQGTLDSKLIFGADGKLLSTKSERNVQEGMRPICQSTKLLDKDPLVRRMAEQDILLMGRSCKFYLDEQRAKASPELQDAIDAIWKRIEAGKR